MHKYIVSIATKAANREVAALTDFHKLGLMVVAEELSYDQARDELCEAFKARKLSAATAKVYLSQGFALAQAFATLAEVKAFADENCKGSRSLKRIYDALKNQGSEDADGEDDGEDVAELTATALVDVILANLAHLTDKAEIAMVRDAAIAML